MSRHLEENLGRMMECSESSHLILSEIRQKLNSIINIKQLSFYHVKSDGAAVILNSNLHYLRHYVDKKHYLFDPHIVRPSNINSGIKLWSTYKDPRFHGEHVFDIKAHFNLDHGMSYIIQKNDSEYKAYTFTTNVRNYGIYNQYLNYCEYLEFFIKYMDNIVFTEIDDICDYYVDMQAIKGEQFITQKGITDNTNMV